MWDGATFKIIRTLLLCLVDAIFPLGTKTHTCNQINTNHKQFSSQEWEISIAVSMRASRERYLRAALKDTVIPPPSNTSTHRYPSTSLDKVLTIAISWSCWWGCSIAGGTSRTHGLSRRSIPAISPRVETTSHAWALSIAWTCNKHNTYMPLQTDAQGTALLTAEWEKSAHRTYEATEQYCHWSREAQSGCEGESNRLQNFFSAFLSPHTDSYNRVQFKSQTWPAPTWPHSSVGYKSTNVIYYTVLL